MRVLGIDPGTNITGFGCVDMARKPTLVEGGVFRLNGSGVGAASVSSRLAELDTDIRDLLERVAPDVVAVESLFAHYKHPATAITMGHARGVILLAIERSGAQLHRAQAQRGQEGADRSRPRLQVADPARGDGDLRPRASCRRRRTWPTRSRSRRVPRGGSPCLARQKGHVRSAADGLISLVPERWCPYNAEHSPGDYCRPSSACAAIPLGRAETAKA